MRQISLFRRRQVLLKMATLSCPGRQLSCSTGPSPPTHQQYLSYHPGSADCPCCTYSSLVTILYFSTSKNLVAPVTFYGNTCSLTHWPINLGSHCHSHARHYLESLCSHVSLSTHSEICFSSPNAQAEANLGSGALLQFDCLLSHEGIPLCKPWLYKPPIICLKGFAL